MTRSHFAFALGLLCLLSLAALAQPALPGPDVAKLSNLTFGWVSMSGVDPTLEMLTSFAPTTMALRDAGYRTGGEVVTGKLNFSDLEVDSNFQSAMTAVGPGIVRICQYAYETNLALVPNFAPYPARTDGEAIEISYAQPVKNAVIGVSLVPKDTSRVTLNAQGMDVVKSTSETEYGARVGAVLKLRDALKVGFDYSYQKDNGTTRVLMVQGMERGAAYMDGPWVVSEGTFITRCATIGASKQFGAKTTGYCAFQNITATGDMEARSADLVWIGVQRSLTKTLAVRANYLDGGGNFSVQWRSPIGIVNLAYTHNALMNAEKIIGKGDAAFAALALAF